MSLLLRHLEANGPLTPADLEAATRRQQQAGGSLDTALLELGLLTPSALDACLQAACGLPGAPVRLLERGQTRPWDHVPKDLLDIGWALPLAVEDGKTIVAVHPELPDAKLGQLFRQIRGFHPVVAPECCLAKIAAERSGAILAPRYALLVLDYLQALRAEAAPSPVPAASPMPAPDAAAPPLSPAPVSSTRIDSDAPVLEVSSTPAPAAPVPTASHTASPPAPSPPAPVPSASQDPGAAAPALAAAPAPTAARRRSEPAAASRAGASAPAGGQQPTPAQRLEAARTALAAARERDRITEALVRAAAIVAPRVALFGVKREGLRVLAAPGSALRLSEGLVIPLPEGGLLDRAVTGQAPLHLLVEPSLSFAVGQPLGIPCVFEPVLAGGRTVLMLYLDRAGIAFDPSERTVLRELCDTARHSLEALLRLLGWVVPAGQTSPAGQGATRPAVRPHLVAPAVPIEVPEITVPPPAPITLPFWPGGRSPGPVEAAAPPASRHADPPAAEVAAPGDGPDAERGPGAADGQEAARGTARPAARAGASLAAAR